MRRAMIGASLARGVPTGFPPLGVRMNNLGLEATLSAHTAETLQDAWRRAARAGWDQVEAADVEEIAQVLASDARQRALTPEQMLVLVKRSWSTGLGPQSVAERRAAQQVLDDVISGCIAHFFDD